MSMNYNAARFGKDGDLTKTNDAVLNELRTVKCNNCRHFAFGGRKCNKKNEAGELVRPGFTPITFVQSTDKGDFINVLKPSDCNDFERKGAKKEDSDEAADRG